MTPTHPRDTADHLNRLKTLKLLQEQMHDLAARMVAADLRAAGLGGQMLRVQAGSVTLQGAQRSQGWPLGEAPLAPATQDALRRLTLGEGALELQLDPLRSHHVLITVAEAGDLEEATQMAEVAADRALRGDAESHGPRSAWGEGSGMGEYVFHHEGPARRRAAGGDAASAQAGE